MIVPMRKVTILVSENHVEESLKVLRRAGMVHIKHIHEPSAGGLDALEQESADCRQALQTLADVPSPERSGSLEYVPFLVREVVTLARDRQQRRQVSRRR